MHPWCLAQGHPSPILGFEQATSPIPFLWGTNWQWTFSSHGLTLFFCTQPLWFLRQQWECGRNEESGCKLQTSLQMLCKGNLSPLMKLLLPVDAFFSSSPTDSSTGMTRLAWRHWTLAGTCPCVFTLESNMFTGTQTLQCSKAAWRNGSHKDRSHSLCTKTPAFTQLHVFF